MPTAVNVFPIAGLVYDIVGAAFIARAIVFTADKLLIAQSGTYFNGNQALFAALENQRHDGRFGLAILIGGFLLQLVGAFGLHVPLSHWPTLIMLVGGLVAMLLWYFLAGHYMNRSSAARFTRHLKEREREGGAGMRLG